ncbi:uncharacterized protein [Nicotiana sylvestris]|uniref:uncharacterized protein n=1 Tax=Nicotiana sylvestris TaxID=4096 RepID=UPI00388C3BC6
MNLKKWSLIEESILKQKSRAQWIQLGDSNSKYFAIIIKERIQRKQIKELKALKDGKMLTNPNDLKQEIVSFYKGLMGSSKQSLRAVNKIVMRLDGYNAYFYKRAWSVVGPEIINAVKRKISDNIFLAQELVKSYTRENVSPRCMIKIDIQKAYDSVEWVYLEQMLDEMGFPRQFISWVLECVTTVNYSILVNGKTTVPFNAAKGLRQGDLISPFLFAIAMEYLSRMLNKMIFCYFKEVILNLWILLEDVSWSSLMPQAYLSQFPSKVLNAIEAYCRSYLWSGTNIITRKALLAWEKVCTPKSMGGLGLINMRLWNKATIIKANWDIEHKVDRLWIRWVHSYYIKNQKFDQMVIPMHAGWMMQGKLLKVDRIAAWGINVDRVCKLCNRHDETRNYLFMECPYSMEIWEGVLKWMKVQHFKIAQRWRTGSLKEQKAEQKELKCLRWHTQNGCMQHG